MGEQSAASARGLSPASLADVLLAAVLVVVAQVDVWWPELAVWGDDPVAGPPLVNAVLLGGLAAATAWRRSAPLAAVVVGCALVVLQAFISGDPPIGLLIAGPVLVLAYSVAAFARPRRASIGLGCLAAAAALHGALDIRTAAQLEDATWWWLLIALTWLAGLAVGTRRRARDDAERARVREVELARTAQEAAAAERLRIAGELHDSVAHSVSVVALQAGAALELLERNPVRARAPLEAIEEIARATLAEMGALVGVLRATDDEPASGVGLQALPDLARRVTAAGLPVHLRTSDVGTLPPGVDRAAFRIIQESVTNALRHAVGATRVDVEVGRDEGSLRIRVADDGGGPSASPPVGGHGIIGMRERAAVCGGELRAGPGDGVVGTPGFAVTARLPVASDG
ncbi:sensor histidine kinase [Agrococcus beijingensis]|uniref:sensor histidine kinase n=1 Tax=Agrococcus beijingensis TaxID=3068634 RepID=UPI0027418FF9|nr:histidine kinase [Agrococcus sp. REN33]